MSKITKNTGYELDIRYYHEPGTRIGKGGTRLQIAWSCRCLAFDSIYITSSLSTCRFLYDTNEENEGADL